VAFSPLTKTTLFVHYKLPWQKQLLNCHFGKPEIIVGAYFDVRCRIICKFSIYGL